MKSGKRPNAATNSCSWLEISLATISRRNRCKKECRAVSRFERNIPSHTCRKFAAQRLIRRGQRNMQPDRDAGFAGIENVERGRLGAIEIRSDYHHGGGIDPPTHDEITDCNIDCRRHAVIIGTQPDMSTRAVTPSINDIPVFHRGLPVYYRSKPNPAQELKPLFDIDGSAWHSTNHAATYVLKA